MNTMVIKLKISNYSRADKKKLYGIHVRSLHLKHNRYIKGK